MFCRAKILLFEVQLISPSVLKGKLQDTKHQYCDIADAGQLMLNALHVWIFSCSFPFAQMPFAISEFFFSSQSHSLFSSFYCIKKKLSFL